MKGPRLCPALRDQPQRVLGPQDVSGASAWRPLNHTRTTLRAGFPQRLRSLSHTWEQLTYP